MDWCSNWCNFKDQSLMSREVNGYYDQRLVCLKSSYVMNSTRFCVTFWSYVSCHVDCTTLKSAVKCNPTTTNLWRVRTYSMRPRRISLISITFWLHIEKSNIQWIPHLNRIMAPPSGPVLGFCPESPHVLSPDCKHRLGSPLLQQQPLRNRDWGKGLTLTPKMKRNLSEAGNTKKSSQGKIRLHNQPGVFCFQLSSHSPS